jgi:hypothetical protein
MWYWNCIGYILKGGIYMTLILYKDDFCNGNYIIIKISNWWTMKYTEWFLPIIEKIYNSTQVFVQISYESFSEQSLKYLT